MIWVTRHRPVNEPNVHKDEIFLGAIIDINESRYISNGCDLRVILIFIEFAFNRFFGLEVQKFLKPKFDGIYFTHIKVPCFHSWINPVIKIIRNTPLAK